MEVKEFIKNVLVDVTGAVTEAGNEKYTFGINRAESEGIDFDLAVILKKNAQGKIKAEMFTVVGADVEGGMSEEAVNRIKFRVIPYKK